MIHRQFLIASENIKSALRTYEQAAEDARRTAEKYRELDRLLDLLRRSWRHEDPGKYGDHAFFLKGVEFGPTVASGLHGIAKVEKLWVREMLDDAAAAERGRPARYGGDPVAVPLGSFSDIAMRDCGNCRCPAPLVGQYRQTYDSPDGDEWRLDIASLCIGCMTVTPVGVRVSEYRFM